MGEWTMTCIDHWHGELAFGEQGKCLRLLLGEASERTLQQKHIPGIYNSCRDPKSWIGQTASCYSLFDTDEEFLNQLNKKALNGK